MKKLLLGLAFLIPLLAYASTTTPNLGLVIPATGDQNWDVQLRNDATLIDSGVPLLTLANYFLAQQRMASLRLDGALSLYSGASGSGLVTFQNSSVLNKNRLILSASDGMFINGAEFPGGASVSAGDLVLYPGTGHTYGTFAVIGSSADGTTAYSGFSATAPITTSTIWTLPKADGTANQPLVTDGSGHLSFSSESGTFIQNTNTLQTGTTFYVSSGTVSGQLTVGSAIQIPSMRVAASFPHKYLVWEDDANNGLLGRTGSTSGLSRFGIYTDGVGGLLTVSTDVATTNGFWSSLGDVGFGVDGGSTHYGVRSDMFFVGSGTQYAGYFDANTSNETGGNYALWASADINSTNRNYALWIDKGSFNLETSTPTYFLQPDSSHNVQSYDIFGGTQSFTGTNTFTGIIQIPSKTLVQLRGLAPTAVGQIYYCSDCATDAEVISTGTATGAWGRVSARTTTIQ